MTSGHSVLQAIATGLLISLTTIMISHETTAAQPEELLRSFGRGQVVVETSKKGCVLFDVYVAQTADQRSQGLMHIRSMDNQEGMIFLYPKAVRIYMWMKNTYIPLDMLFIAANQKIVHVHENATPHSETIIDSAQDTVAVIELNAGIASQYGITSGGRIYFSTQQL